MKTVVVTGPKGFIGGNLVAQLLEQEQNVLTITRDSVVLQDSSKGCLKLFKYDEVLPNIEREFPNINVTSIYHLATKFLVDHSPKDLTALINDNILFTSNLLEAFKSCGATFINCMSYWQFAENSNCRAANNLYAATKNASDQILNFYSSKYDFPVANVVIGDTYGPNDTRGKLIYSIMDAALNGTSITINNPEHTLAPVHVCDIASGLQKVADLESQPNDPPYNLIGNQEFTIRQIVETAAECWNANISVDWGGKTKRHASNLKPWRCGQRVPGWLQKIEFKSGLKALWPTSAS